MSIDVDFGDGAQAWGGAARHERWPRGGLSAELAEIVDNFDPGQPRDADGRWSEGGGEGSAVPASPEHKVHGVVVTPPPPAVKGERLYAPDVTADRDRDGVTDAARVGVPAMSVPPPPSIGRLPNLTPHERAVEAAFISHYEANPDGVAGGFRDVIHKTTRPGEPPAFGTDDAKVLAEPWTHPDPETRAENRATLNLALHQTANAIAKRAFLQELDALKPGDQIMVTAGGCGSGKGWCLSSVPEALAVKKTSSVVWDSAGDQNSTENVWIQREAEKRGLKAVYVYVHADPRVQWADPTRGVVKRASDPKDGRMVDARVFADSYAIGAKNFEAFHRANEGNPKAGFVFLDNTGKPKLVDGIPKEGLNVNRDELLRFAERTVDNDTVPARVKLGATEGRRVWQG